MKDGVSGYFTTTGRETWSDGGYLFGGVGVRREGGPGRTKVGSTLGGEDSGQRNVRRRC